MNIVRILLCSIVVLFTISESSGTEDEVTKLYSTSVRLWQEGKLDSAFDLANQAFAGAGEINDSTLLAKCLNNLGLIYRSKGELPKAFLCYEQSLGILKSIQNQDLIPVAELNLGIAYKDQAIYDKSMFYLFDAANLFESSGRMNELASAYNSIAIVFRLEGEFEKSRIYNIKALNIWKESNYIKGIAKSYNNLGSVHKDLNQLDSALRCFGLSLEIKEKQNSPEQVANTLSNIAEIYRLKNDLNQAETYYNRALKIIQPTGNSLALAYIHKDLAELDFSRTLFKEAEVKSLISLKYAQQSQVSKLILECYELLANINSKKNNFQRAFEYSQKSIDLNAQILGEEKQKLLTQMEVKYETEKKQQEINSLNKEQEIIKTQVQLKDLQLKSKSQANRNLIVVLILLTLLFGSVVLFFRTKNKYLKRVDSILRELHHRVKNNFQVLLSIFNLQLNTIEDTNAKALIISNRNRLMAMMLIHNGLYLDQDATKVKIQYYIQNLIDNLLISFGINSESIAIEYQIPSSMEIDVDKSISLGLIINELATNSFKYAFNEENENPTLKIEIIKFNNGFQLSYEDNGPGLSTAGKKRTFGLKLIESQVKQLKGTMERVENGGLHYSMKFG